MPTNHTPNYQLNQWVRSDKVLMEDFNADNARIDAALKAEADVRASAVAALNSQVAKLGNCRIETKQYTGTGTFGTDNPTKFSFSGRPAFFVIYGNRSVAMGYGGSPRLTIVSYSNGQNTSFTCESWGLAWSGNQFSLATNYFENQLNTANATYNVVAFYALS